jgi:hypothetical protein
MHLLRRRNQPLGLEPSDDINNTLLNALLSSVNGDFGVLRRLIGGADTRELLDLARPCLLVQAFRIALLGHLDRHLDVYFDERDRLVRRPRRGRGVDFARQFPVRFERGDEGCQGDCGGVCEELCDLFLFC